MIDFDLPAVFFILLENSFYKIKTLCEDADAETEENVVLAWGILVYVDSFFG